MKLPVWKRLIYLLAAIVFIPAWMLLHPKQVWAQAKKEYGDAWRDYWRKP